MGVGIWEPVGWDMGQGVGEPGAGQGGSGGLWSRICSGGAGVFSGGPTITRRETPLTILQKKKQQQRSRSCPYKTNRAVQCPRHPQQSHKNNPAPSDPTTTPNKKQNPRSQPPPLLPPHPLPVIPAAPVPPERCPEPPGRPAGPPERALQNKGSSRAGAAAATCGSSAGPLGVPATSRAARQPLRGPRHPPGRECAQPRAEPPQPPVQRGGRTPFFFFR